jgi:nudix-type nucleoside diphosphatase (YffH/AdpP family)
MLSFYTNSFLTYEAVFQGELRIMNTVRRVKILKKKRVFDGFLKLDEIHFQQETYQGEMSDVIPRLVLERGDSVASIVHNVEADLLYFVEQFRIATYDKKPGWLLELPAGKIDDGEQPEQSIVREIEEEIGYRPKNSTLVGVFYLSPGGSSERIFLYYCSITNADYIGKGGGIATEQEFIKIIQLSRNEAFSLLEAGHFVDAKTIIGLQWLRLQYARQQKVRQM